MSVNVVRELEELRSMLDTPKKMYTPGSRIPSTAYDVTPTPAAAGVSRAGYGFALHSAERSVDRLGKAIEMAEEEMDAALRRTTDVHKNQLRQKEFELQEMQRLLQAKERSIDSLRDTLATTKRTYESRLSQAEAEFAMKDAEATAAHEELHATRSELEALQVQMRRAASSQSREAEELRERVKELQGSVSSYGDEATRLASQLQAEREDRRSAQQQAEELRRQVALLAEELQMVRTDARIAKENFERDTEDLRRRLRAERSIRKACEKWLRAELKSREEYDMLLLAIRETASSGGSYQAPGALKSLQGRLGSLPSPLAHIPGAGTEVQEVERLLENLKASAGISSPGGADEHPGNTTHTRQHSHHQDASLAALGKHTAAAAAAAPAARRKLPLGATEGYTAGGRYGSSGSPPSLLLPEAEAARRRAEEDNRRLKAELLAAKRLLHERAAS